MIKVDSKHGKLTTFTNQQTKLINPQNQKAHIQHCEKLSQLTNAVYHHIQQHAPQNLLWILNEIKYCHQHIQNQYL